MPSWFKTTLTKNEIIAGNGTTLQGDFTKVFTQVKGPDNMAMFGSERDRGTFYFAIPEDLEMELFKTSWNLQASGKPEKSDCTLLVGNEATAFALLN